MSENGNALLELRGQVQSMNMAPVFLRNSLQLGTYANSAGLRTALLQWCHSSRNFGATPTASSGNGTSADDDRMQVDSLKKGKRKGKGKKPTSEMKSHDQHELYRPQHVQALWQTWTFRRKTAGIPSGGAYDNSTSNNSNMQKGKNHKKGKGESKHVDVVETNQPSETASTVSYPPQTPSTIGELLCHSNVEPCIMGVTINSVSTRRQSGA